MQIACLEYEPLRESDEVAVKSWVEIMLSFDAGLGGVAGTLARQRGKRLCGDETQPTSS
jgi:hypothetical protein